MTAVADQIWGSAAEDPVCYICYDTHSDENPFLPVRICMCRGSLALHRSCFSRLTQHSQICSICKHPYKNPLLAEITYDPQDPDLQGAHIERFQHELEYLSSLYEFYCVDAEGRKHGVCKIYYADESLTYYTPPWTLYEVRNYVHGKLHGAYKRYSRIQFQQMQHLELELRFEFGSIRGPFKEYDSHNAGQLIRAGNIDSSPITNPRAITRNYSDCRFVGNYVEYKDDEPVVNLCFGKPCSDVLNPEPAALADGTWKINGEEFGIQNGVYHGPWVNGTEHCNYIHGQLHGAIKTYHEEGTYDYDKRQGPYKIFQTVEGERMLQKFLQYNNGELCGECKFFDATGNISSVITYADGLYDGPAIYYDSYGRTVQSCGFKQDALHGTLELYENGVRRARLQMADGRIEPGSCIILNTPKGALERLVQIGPDGQDIDETHCLSRFTIFKA